MSAMRSSGCVSDLTHFIWMKRLTPAPGCSSICPGGIVESRPSVKQLREEIADLRRQLEDAKVTAASDDGRAIHGHGHAEISYRRAQENIPPSATPQPLSSASHIGPLQQEDLSSTTVALPRLESGTHGLNHSRSPGPLQTVDVPAVGQLSITAGGRSRFFGPNAAAHILPDDEDEDARDEQRLADDGSGLGLRSQTWGAFPFCFQSWESIVGDAQASFPAFEEVQRVCDVYWTASSWRFEPITKTYLEPLLLEVYAAMTTKRRRRHAAELAVVCAVLAIGYLFDETRPPHSAEAQHFNALSLACLSAADFLTNTSVATL
jgi:hypothetical protein